MKLSEAIRLGSMLRPQAIGHLFKDGKSCAMGAAYEASGVLAEDDRWYFDAELKPWADAWNQAEPGACPVDACGYYGLPVSLCAMVAHLNDHHQWTRERIADWVERLESPQAVEEQIPVGAAEA